MVPSIARQSVIIKCNMQRSVITGNYELYYIAGLLAKLKDVSVQETMKPDELLAELQEQTKDMDSDDERIAYLIQMVQDYRPDEAFDEQTTELFLMGKNENYLWQVNVPAGE